MGRRITRKQLKKEDEFVSTVDTMIQWGTENWRPVVAGLGVVVVIALVWWGATSWTRSRASQASLLLENAVETYEGEPDPQTGAPTGDEAAAEEQYRQVVEHYGSSDQADEARLYLARIALEDGRTDEGRAILVELTQRRGNDVIGRLATLDLISLRIASGQSDEVAAELEAMVTGQSDALPRDVALYQLGELYVREAEPERATEYFQKLAEEFPESPYAAVAQRRLRELG
jgi:predicted negative regulator of RcsB-dependent stress response